MIIEENRQRFKLNLVEKRDCVEVTKDGYRTYTFDGETYPSMTTVLKATQDPKKEKSLEAWREREPDADAILKNSSERGERLHDLCEKFLHGERLELDKDAESDRMFLYLARLMKTGVKEVYGTELPMFNRKYGIAGRTDLYCNWMGVPSIVDYKNSRKFKRKEWITDYYDQVVGYSEMVEDTYPDMPKPEQVVILIALEGGGCTPYQDRITPILKNRFEERMARYKS